MTTKKKLNIARDYYFRNYNILDIAEKNNISIEKTQFIIRGYDLTPEVKMVKNLKYELMQKKPDLLIELTPNFSYLKVN